MYSREFLQCKTWAIIIHKIYLDSYASKIVAEIKLMKINASIHIKRMNADVVIKDREISLTHCGQRNNNQLYNIVKWIYMLIYQLHKRFFFMRKYNAVYRDFIRF